MHDDKCSCILNLEIIELNILQVTGDFHRNESFKCSGSGTSVPEIPSSGGISKKLSPTSMTFGRGPI